MSEKKKVYPHDAETVYESLKEVCARSWFRINRTNDSIRRIILSTPLSLFSYGETIEVIVQPEGNDKSLVYVKSEPKVFFNITAGSAVERNIRKIFQMLDEVLK